MPAPETNPQPTILDSKGLTPVPPVDPADPVKTSPRIPHPESHQIFQWHLAPITATLLTCPPPPLATAGNGAGHEWTVDSWEWGVENNSENQDVMDNTDLNFIKECVQNGRMFWTYHSGMRLEGRGIARETIIGYIDSAEIIVSYDDDTPLPSCLCLLHGDGYMPIHVVIAVDKPGNNVRIITVYKPDAMQWIEDFRKRR